SQSCLQLFVWWLSFVFVDRAPSDIYTLSLHDALPISVVLGGIVAVPVLAAIALAVRLSSPGPVLYTQWRLGRDGRPFRIWKFRSDRKSTRLNSSHVKISYAVFCLKKKKIESESNRQKL